jgi:hypothetical protein
MGSVLLALLLLLVQSGIESSHAVQLCGQLGAHTRIDVAPYVQYRDIVHPIFRVIDQISP